MAKSYNDKITEKNESQRKKEKRYLNVLARIYVIFVLAIYPLYVGLDGYNDIIHSKAVLYWIVTISFFVAFSLFFLVYILGRGRGGQTEPFWKGLCVPDYSAAAFLLIITLSCVFSPYREMVLLGTNGRHDGWLTYACMLLSFFIISRWYKPSRLDFIFFGISAILFSIYSYLQFYGYDFLNLFPYTQSNMLDSSGNPVFSGYSILFRSTIGNIDFVSAYVCMVVVLFGALYVKSVGRIRFFYFAVSVMGFVSMIIAEADAGKVGVLGAFVLLIPYWFSEKISAGRMFSLVSMYGIGYFIHHSIVINMVLPLISEASPSMDHNFKQTYSTLPLNPILIISLMLLIAGLALIFLKLSWPKRKTARIVGVVILAASMLVGVAGVAIVGQRLPETNIIHEASEVLRGNMDDHFGSYRGFIWKRALAKGPENLLLGSGMDTFFQAFGDANQEESQQLVGVIYDKAHNDFVQLFMCNGILGLLSYLALIISIMILSIKKAFDDIYLFAVFSAALAYLAQSFFGIDTLTVTPIFWLLLAMIRARQKAARQDNPQINPQS